MRTKTKVSELKKKKKTTTVENDESEEIAIIKFFIFLKLGERHENLTSYYKRKRTRIASDEL